MRSTLRYRSCRPHDDWGQQWPLQNQEEKTIEPTVISTQDIARVCHEANRALCMTQNDSSQPKWEDAPDWQKNSALDGVKFHFENPDAGASASHDNWREDKVNDGWTWGPVKDPEKKQHPCMVAFDELPIQQRLKDYLFKSIVHALQSDVPEHLIEKHWEEVAA